MCALIFSCSHICHVSSAQQHSAGNPNFSLTLIKEFAPWKHHKGKIAVIPGRKGSEITHWAVDVPIWGFIFILQKTKQLGFSNISWSWAHFDSILLLYFQMTSVSTPLYLLNPVIHMEQLLSSSQGLDFPEFRVSKEEGSEMSTSMPNTPWKK